MAIRAKRQHTAKRQDCCEVSAGRRQCTRLSLESFKLKPFHLKCVRILSAVYLLCALSKQFALIGDRLAVQWPRVFWLRQFRSS